MSLRGTLKSEQLSDSSSASATLPHGRKLEAEIQDTRRALRADTAWRELSETGGKLDHKPASEKEIAAAGNLYRAMHGGIWGLGSRADLALNTLRELTQEQLSQVIAIYRDFDHPNKRDLIKDLTRELSGLAKQEALALLKSDLLSADALGLRRSIGKFNEGAQQVHRLLAVYERNDLPLLLEKYQQLFHKPLEQDLRTALYGANLNLCLDILHGKSIEANLIKSLRQDVIEFPHLRTEDNRAQKLIILLAEKRPNGEQVRKLLEGLSKKHVEELRLDFNAASGGLTLDAVIEKKLSGRSLHLSKQYLKGLPETLDQALARVQEDNQFEKKGAAGFLLKRFSHNGKIQTNAIKRVETELDQARSDSIVTTDENLRIKELTHIAAVAGRVTAESKDILAERSRKAASITLGTGLTVATGGAAIAIPMATAAAAIIGPEVKRFAAGKSYEKTERNLDMRKSAIEATISAGVGSLAHGVSSGSTHFSKAISDTSSGALKISADRVIKVGSKVPR